MRRKLTAKPKSSCHAVEGELKEETVEDLNSFPRDYLGPSAAPNMEKLWCTSCL